MIVTSWNPETDKLEKSYLTGTYQAGSTTIKIQNVDRFGVNDFVLLGEMGTEQAELVRIDTVDGNTGLTLVGGTKFTHVADEPVYKMRYDQVQFYRSTSPDGSYELLDSVPIDVDNKNLQTAYKDTTGTGASFYKTKYYNTVSFEESIFSDYISAEGYGRKTIGSVIESVVRRVKDAGYSVLMTEDYLDIATEVNDDISSQSERPYNFMRSFVKLNRIAGQAYLELPEDYYKFSALEYTNTVGAYPRVSSIDPISRSRFDTQHNIAKSDYIRAVTIDDEERRILLKPAPNTSMAGAFTLWFYEQLTEFVDLSQEVKTPNTLIYRYKFLAEFYAAKTVHDSQFGALAQRYEQKYGNELMKLQRSNRKDVGSPRSFMDSAKVASVSYTPGKAYTL